VYQQKLFVPEVRHLCSHVSVLHRRTRTHTPSTKLNWSYTEWSKSQPLPNYHYY